METNLEKIIITIPICATIITLGLLTPGVGNDKVDVNVKSLTINIYPPTELIENLIPTKSLDTIGKP